MRPSPDDGPAVELRNVSRSFGSVTALQGVDLAIRPGMTTVLIGPSGCGKSSLLRLIIGLIRADEGEVFFQGTRVRPESLLPMRRRMGYVIQDGGLFPHLTARGNVTIMARHLGWNGSRIGERLEELVRITRFPPDGLDRFPPQLSGGQLQRVSLMRALMLDPDVLLLDEPLGALDPMIRAELQTDLKRIFRALGKTVVLVTHDMGEAVFFGERIVLLRDGRIVQQGTPNELLRAPSDPFVMRFINAQRSLLDRGTGGREDMRDAG